MRGALPAACVAWVLHAAPLGASPSRWDEARDPSQRKIDHALTRAIQARASRDLVREALPFAETLFALRAATVLEMEGGRELARPDVWFFLGDALVVSDHGDDERGRALLREALALEPNSPLAARALRDIAVASSRLVELDAVEAAVTAALRLEWDGDRRAELLLLRAGASMARGEIDRTEDDYRAVLDSVHDAEKHALAEWGLGVALARGGDLSGALRHAQSGSGMRFSDSQGNSITVLELPTVHLAPDYDLFYYRALAAMAASEHAPSQEEARTELEWAVASWKRYLIAGRETQDRYVAGAEQTLRSCERRLAALRTSGGAPRHRGAGPRQ